MTGLCLFQSLRKVLDCPKKGHKYGNHEPLALQLLFYPIDIRGSAFMFQYQFKEMELMKVYMSIKSKGFRPSKENLALQRCTSNFQLSMQSVHNVFRVVVQWWYQIN